MTTRSLVSLAAMLAVVALTYGLAAGASAERRAQWTSEQAALAEDATRLEVELVAARDRIEDLEERRTELRAALDPEVTAAVAEVNRLVRERRCGALAGTAPPGFDMDQVVDATIAEVAPAHPGIPDPSLWRSRLDTAPLTYEICFPPPPPPPEPPPEAIPPEARTSPQRAEPAPSEPEHRVSRRSWRQRAGGRIPARPAPQLPAGGGCRTGRC